MDEKKLKSTVIRILIMIALFVMAFAGLVLVALITSVPAYGSPVERPVNYLK